MQRPTSRPLSSLVTLSTFLAGSPASAGPGKPGGGHVDEFYGTFNTELSIEAPPFHGIEPQLALSYTSAAGNGFAGVGWSVKGFSVIERASPGKGAPKYDAGDIYLLDGQELLPCSADADPSTEVSGSIPL